MRGAAVHQRHQSFDFPDNAGQGQQMAHPAMMQYPYTLPTPPQTGEPGTNFMTPSPDSPGQWSSASPQSHSDWSEGIHSPPGPNSNKMELISKFSPYLAQVSDISGQCFIARSLFW